MRTDTGSSMSPVDASVPATGSKRASAGVCPLATGWCWYADLEGGTLDLQVFVDAASLEPLSRASVTVLYYRLVRSCSISLKLLEHAEPGGSVAVFGASLVLSEPLLTATQARVGVAALMNKPVIVEGRIAMREVIVVPDRPRDVWQPAAVRHGYARRRAGAP